jgi:hypothetical protein
VLLIFGRPEIKSTRNVDLIFSVLTSDEVTSVFTVFRFKNMDTEKLISAVFFVWHAMYINKS